MFSTNRSVFNIYLIYFVSMALFTIVRILSNVGAFSFLPDKWSSLIFTVIIQVFIMFLIPLLLYTWFNHTKSVKKSFAEVSIKPIKMNVVVLSLLLGIAAFFINLVVSSMFNGIITFFGYEIPTTSSSGAESIFSPTVQFLLDVLTVAVLPAFCEEFLHRGMLLHQLEKIGYKKAIVISALMFGLIHFNINQISYAFVLGLLMALVTVTSKTLIPAIIIHFTNNFLSVYLSAAKENGWFLSNFYTTINNFFASESMLMSFVMVSLFIVVLAFAVSYLIFLLFKETTVYNVNRALKGIYDGHKNEKADDTTAAEKDVVLNEMLKTKSNLNLNFSQTPNLLDVILPVNRVVVKPTLYDNVFFIACCVLGGLVTIFTFLWGVLW